MGIPTAESGLVKGVLSLLSYRGAFAFRNNTGALRTPAGGFLRFGMVGAADIIGVLPGGRFLAVEAKTKGARPTPAQFDFLERVKAAGGVAVWVTDLMTVEAILAELARDPAARFTLVGDLEGC